MTLPLDELIAEKLNGKARPLYLTAGIYLGATAALFLGTSFTNRINDFKKHLTQDEKIFQNEDRITRYSSRDMPFKILTFGEYLAYEAYGLELKHQIKK